MSTGNLDFEQFRVFLEKACGILLGENKQYLVSSRLNKLMEQQGIKSLGELVQRIQAQPRGGLREQVVDAMTTNETLWFRDTYPFEVLKNKVIPEFIRNSQQNPGDVVVDTPGLKPQVGFTVHGRDQEQVDQPTNAQQAQGEEPDGPGNRLAVIEAMGPGEAENPQQVANGFAVGVVKGHPLLITVHS